MTQYNFKKVSDCPLDEVISTWNRAFEGYSVDVTMDSKAFLRRMVTEDLVPEASLITFDGDLPVAIVMNGIRKHHDKLYAWNGGTGIIPAYRGTGLSQTLMEEVQKVYHQQGVTIANLEAITTNERAINLYEKHGYELIERLGFYEGPIEEQDITVIHDYELECVRVPREKIQSLSFFKQDMPWQNQLESLKEGIGYILYDRERPIGYAVTKELYDLNGNVKSVLLYQVGIEPILENDLLLMLTFLHKIFKLDRDDVKRHVINYPNRDTVLLHALGELGFNKTVEQVHMKKLL